MSRKILKNKKTKKKIKEIIYPDNKNTVEEVLVDPGRVESRPFPKRKKLTKKDEKVINELSEYFTKAWVPPQTEPKKIVNYDKFVDGTLETRITYLANLGSKLNDLLDKISPTAKTQDIDLINTDKFFTNLANEKAEEVQVPTRTFLERLKAWWNNE